MDRFEKMIFFFRIVVILLFTLSICIEESYGARHSKYSLVIGENNERIIRISDKRLGSSSYQRKKRKHDAVADAGLIGDVPVIVKPHKIPHFDYDYLPDDDELYIPKRLHKRQDDEENEEDESGDYAKDIANSFDNYKAWPVQSSKCNPATNKYLSPIDIPTKQATLIKDRSTLFVYSKYPKHKTYQISTQYKYDSVQMEAFTIRRLNEDVIKDTTYISGLGSSTDRFFQSALIMFRPPETNNSAARLPPERSFHKLNGKEFPMEVMFSFESNNHMNPEKTQIHVMVELSEDDNPAWTPIVEMLEPEVWDPDKLWSHIVKEHCEGKKQLEQVYDEYSKSRNNMKKFKGIRNKLVPGRKFDEYFKEIQELYDTVKDMDEKYINQLNKKIDERTKEHAKCKEKLLKLKGKLHTKEDTIADLEKAKGMKKKLNANKLKTARKERDELNIQFQSTLENFKNIQEELNSMEDELEKAHAALQRSSIGDDPDSKYKNVAELKSELESLAKASGDYEKATEEYNKKDLKYKYYNNKPKRSTVITLPFQISWLFPAIGGYYTYPGSFVVKPCNRRSFVIVMENPITISKEQLKPFLNFPTVIKSSLWEDNGPLCDTNQYDAKTKDKDKLKKMQEFVEGLKKIKNQVPVIHELGHRKVEYEKKNLQYVLDDGFHMNSKLRYRLKHGISKGQSLVSTCPFIIFSTLLSLLVTG